MSFNPITFAKGILRKASHKVPKHYEALKDAGKFYQKANKDGSISKRKFKKFKCATCNKFYNRKDVQVDHIEPIGIHTDFTAWTIALIEGDRQVLCEKCHKIKTKQDRKVIKEERDEQKTNDTD